MAAITLSRVVAAPPERVFDIFSDLRSAAGRIRAIVRLEILTDGPIGVGTRFRETRRMFGREASETMEVIDFRPPHGYAIRAESCGTRYVCAFSFRPHGEGTSLEARFEATPLTFATKLLSPLTGLLMSTGARKCLEQDLNDLQKAAESASPAPA